MSSLFDILQPSAGNASGRIGGVVTGTVTNNNDPEKLGRVKVRFGWLSASHESNWARIAVAMAGGARGTYFVPEVDDEVLVAFEHGDIDYPYIVVSLWNSRQKPPEASDEHNNRRTIKSRSGHIIRLDDSDDAGQIEIVDGTGHNKIVISAADNTITISAEADITIESTGGKLLLRGQGIQISSKAEVNIEAQSGMDLKASGPMTIKGATVSIN